MKAATWMPLYIGDYLADTMHLNATEHGAYLLLLMHSWRVGPLPTDDRSLASIARCDLPTWRRIAPTVRQFFSEADSGLVQGRLERERAEAIQNSGRRAAKARKAAEARWSGDAASNAPSMPNAVLAACPSPSPSPVRATPSTLSPNGESSEGESPAGADDAPPLPAKKKPPAIPAELLIDMVAAWNEAVAGVLPQVTELSPKRAQRLRARIAERWTKDPLGKWRAYIAAILSSSFLRGESPRGWRADFDWAIRPDSPIAVAEGKYRDSVEDE
jgi:uncharacterized protein YdaU (DUF1376 family)